MKKILLFLFSFQNIISKSFKEMNQVIVELILQNSIQLVHELDEGYYIHSKNIGKGIQGKVYQDSLDNQQVVKLTHPYKDFGEVESIKIIDYIQKHKNNYPLVNKIFLTQYKCQIIILPEVLNQQFPNLNSEDILNQEQLQILANLNQKVFDDLLIFYEKIWGSLADHKNIFKKFTCNQKKKIYGSMLKGLGQLNYLKIAHNDIHPGNIMFKYDPETYLLNSQEEILMLGDYGMMKKYDENHEDQMFSDQLYDLQKFLVIIQVQESDPDNFLGYTSENPNSQKIINLCESFLKQIKKQRDVHNNNVLADGYMSGYILGDEFLEMECENEKIEI